MSEYEGNYEPETLKNRLMGVYTVGDGKGYELTRDFTDQGFFIKPISKEAVHRIETLESENEALKDDVAALKFSLTECLDAASAISKDEDLDWHHEAIEKAAKILKSK